MPIYNFACDECKIYWEVEGSMASPPQPEDNPCPECSGASYRSFVPTALQFKGTGFQTNISKVEKFHRDGFSKHDALEFYETSIKNTKERINNAHGAYSRMYINPEHGLKKGSISVKSDKEARDKAEAAKTIIKEAQKRVKK